MNEEEAKLKKVLSDAFTEYGQAYRSNETKETVLFPRDKYPDIVSYQTFKIMEDFEIKTIPPKPQENKN